MWKNILIYLIINQENDPDISVLKREHYILCTCRHVAFILKMKCHWINVKRNLPEKIDFRQLTVGEIKTAEHQIIVQAQREYYHKELNSLRNNKLLLKNSTLSSLRPMLTNNSLHAGVESTSLVFTI